MRISDWSSDVCSSDLRRTGHRHVTASGDLSLLSDAESRLAAREAAATAVLAANRAAERRVAVAESCPGGMVCAALTAIAGSSDRSEERRVGKSGSVRLDSGGRGILKKKINNKQ